MVISFSPEEELLVAIAKPHAERRDFERAEACLSSPGFRWSVALGLALAHGVDPMLAWNLSTQHSQWEALPTTVRTHLSAALATAQVRYSLYQQALAPVFERLQSESVPFVLMKGAVVAETVYPPGTRPLDDFDLLVPEAHRSAAVNAFSRSGFRLVSNAAGSSSPHEATFATQRDGVLICADLHWDVYPETNWDAFPRPRPFRFDAEELIARSRPQRFGSQGVSGLSPEDAFVHYATQLFNDAFSHRLLRICDLYGLAAVGLDPQRLVAIARDAGAAGVTHTALYGIRLLGAQVPTELLDRLARECPSCAIASEFLADAPWLFRRRTLAVGAQLALSPMYFQDAHGRRRYRSSLLRTAYADERRRGHRAALASIRSARVALSTLVCGALLRLAAAGPSAANRYLRDLLWRHG